MKKLRVIGALALATQSCLAVDTEKIEDAIKQSSLTQVESRFAEVDREEMTPEVRKEMYKNLYDLAVKTTESRTQNLSITGNWWDIAKIGSGAALGLLGGLVLLDSIDYDVLYNDRGLVLDRWGHFMVVPRVDNWQRALSCCIEMSALYLLYKGITCSTQKVEIASAKTIEEFVKAKLNKPGVEPALTNEIRKKI